MGVGSETRGTYATALLRGGSEGEAHRLATSPAPSHRVQIRRLRTGSLARVKSP